MTSDTTTDLDEDRALAEKVGIDLDLGEPLKAEYYILCTLQVLLPLLAAALAVDVTMLRPVEADGVLVALAIAALAAMMIGMSVWSGRCARMLRNEINAWAAYAHFKAARVNTTAPTTTEAPEAP